MSRRSGKSKKVDLKLNLAPPPTRVDVGDTSRRMDESPRRSRSPSPASSCVSSEADSPEATSSMVLAACPRCIMYVMLSAKDPRCPKCKSPVLLDFLSDDINNNTKKN